MKNKTVCIIGLGYIGLPTAALLSNKGYKVFGVDTNSKVVSKINEGKFNFIEKSLEEYIKQAVLSGKFKASNDIQKSDIYMICVPTPFHNSGDIPYPNIDYILSATGNPDIINGEANLQFDGTSLGIGGASTGPRLEIIDNNTGEDLLLIKNANSNGVRVTSGGILQLIEFSTLPTPVDGGIAYSSSNFYVGLG